MANGLATDVLKHCTCQESLTLLGGRLLPGGCRSNPSWEIVECFKSTVMSFMGKGTLFYTELREYSMS